MTRYRNARALSSHLRRQLRPLFPVAPRARTDDTYVHHLTPAEIKELQAQLRRDSEELDALLGID